MDINNSLMSAVRHGELQKVRQLIECYSLRYSKAWSGGYNLLRVATQHGHKEITKLLLMKGAKVNSRNSMLHPSDTPLHFAVTDGDVEVIEMLIDRGAIVNLKNKYGHTPLYNSLQYNNMEITELLLNRGANINDTNCKGITPLHIAVENRAIQTVEYLLNHGACVNPDGASFDFAYTLTGREGYTPLHTCVETGRKEIVKLLLDRNANIHARSLKGTTPLHIAAKRGHIEIVEDLLNRGACINSADIEGYTPLHLAVAESRENVIKLLIKKGAAIEAVTTKDNLTSLYFAVKQRNKKLVNILLKHGANVDAQDTDGMTILHTAVKTANSEIIERILKYCPNVNNESNRSSLYSAVYGYGEIYKTIVKNLLKYGFGVNPEDAHDSTLLHAAIEKGYIKIVEDLLIYGADINMLSKDNETTLHSATKKRQKEVAKLLIEHGAIINAKDESGKTPIVYAIENGHLYITKLLLANGANIKDPGLLSNLLNAAVKARSSKIVGLLLERGANVNGETNISITGLAATAQNELHISARPLKRLTEFTASTEYNLTPLHVAAYLSDVCTVETLLEFGAEVDLEGESGVTALHIAAQGGHVQVVRALLDYCSDINIMTKQNYTPFNLTASNMDVFHDEIAIYRNYDSDSRDMFCRSLLRRRLGDVGMAFEEHIVKMKVANLYVRKENLLAIDRRSHNDFCKNCEKEMANMKRERITNSNITFHDILTKSTRQLAVYARNENIIQVLKSKDFTMTFPIYSGMIRGHFRKGVVRKELLEHCNQFFCSLDYFPKLPCNCVDQIFNYLSDKDLRIFIGIPIRINKDLVATCYKLNDI